MVFFDKGGTYLIVIQSISWLSLVKLLDFQALGHLTSPVGGYPGNIIILSSIFIFINSNPCKILLLMLNYNVSTCREPKISTLEYIIVNQNLLHKIHG